MKLKRIFFLVTIGIFALISYAPKAAEEAKPAIMYYLINPDLMTFYQGSGRKLGYIVVQIQLVVNGQEDYDLVDENIPLIQDSLTDFFNRLEKSRVQDLTQREQLREEAKNKVAETLKEEFGREVITDLLFTKYLYQ